MKKILAVTLVFTLLIAFVASVAGCGKKEDDKKKNDGTGELPEGAVVTKTCDESEMLYYRAIYEETGLNPIMNAGTETYVEVYDENGEMSMKKVYENVTINNYYVHGCKYWHVTEEEYQAIQEYQNETGIQVLYPTVKRSQRPTGRYQSDANIYYLFDQSDKASLPAPILDDNGNFILNYWKCKVGETSSAIIAYNSLRIEGAHGFLGEDGVRYFYIYGTRVDRAIQVRVCQYAYYQYLKTTHPDSVESEEFFFQFNRFSNAN